MIGAGLYGLTDINHKNTPKTAVAANHTRSPQLIALSNGHDNAYSTELRMMVSSGVITEPMAA